MHRGWSDIGGSLTSSARHHLLIVGLHRERNKIVDGRRRPYTDVNMGAACFRTWSAWAALMHLAAVYLLESFLPEYVT